MRVGLVAAGSTMGVLGVALLVLGALSYPTLTTTTVTSSLSISLPHSTVANYTIYNTPGMANAPQSLELRYTSPTPVKVWLTSCRPSSTLPPPCIVSGGALSSTGDYSVTHVKLPYFIAMSNPANNTPGVDISVALSYQTSQGFSVWGELTVLVGGGVLLSGGVLSLFLGLFLRGGVYKQRDPEEELPEEKEVSEPPETVASLVLLDSDNFVQHPCFREA